jgi:hypothetical protein
VRILRAQAQKSGQVLQQTVRLLQTQSGKLHEALVEPEGDGDSTGDEGGDALPEDSLSEDTLSEGASPQSGYGSSPKDDQEVVAVGCLGKSTSKGKGRLRMLPLPIRVTDTPEPCEPLEAPTVLSLSPDSSAASPCADSDRRTESRRSDASGRASHSLTDISTSPDSFRSADCAGTYPPSETLPCGPGKPRNDCVETAGDVRDSPRESHGQSEGVGEGDEHGGADHTKALANVPKRAGMLGLLMASLDKSKELQIKRAGMLGMLDVSLNKSKDFQLPDTPGAGAVPDGMHLSDDALQRVQEGACVNEIHGEDDKVRGKRTGKLGMLDASLENSKELQLPDTPGMHSGTEGGRHLPHIQDTAGATPATRADDAQAGRERLCARSAESMSWRQSGTGALVSCGNRKMLAFFLYALVFIHVCIHFNCSRCI